MATLVVADDRIAYHDYRKRRRLQCLQDLEGPVRAAIVQDNDLVKVISVMTYKGLDNIDLVFCPGDGD